MLKHSFPSGLVDELMKFSKKDLVTELLAALVELTKTSQASTLIPTRDQIAAAIREGFEPAPEGWPERKPWADGALDIADEILRMLVLPEPKAPLQGLEAMVGEIYDGR